MENTNDMVYFLQSKPQIYDYIKKLFEIECSQKINEEQKKLFFFKETINLTLRCDVLAKSRKESNIRGRFLFINCARKSGFKLIQIADFLKIDHSTITHYLKNHKEIKPKENVKIIQDILKSSL